MTTEIINEAEAAEVFRPSPREMADAIARYHKVNKAPRIIFDDRRALDVLRQLVERDGYVDVEGVGRIALELPTDYAWQKERDELNEAIKGYLADEDDRALFVEGVGLARLQSRRTRLCDVAAIFAQEPVLFEELLQRGALKLNLGLVDELTKQGYLQGIKGFIHEGEQIALTIDEKATRR